MNTYQVTISTKYPVAGQRESQIEVTASNRAAALKEARRQVRDENDRMNPFVFRAVVKHEND